MDRVPYEPGAAHQLHWQPGQLGKGLVTPEGTVHTWGEELPDERHPDRALSHRNYCRYSPAIGKDLYSDPELREGSQLFWVDKDGTLEFLSGRSRQDDNLRSQVTKVDPRLREGSPSWSFAKVASAPLVYDVEDLGYPEISGEHPGSEGARPYAYHHDSGAMYVGPEGWYHDDFGNKLEDRNINIFDKGFLHGRTDDAHLPGNPAEGQARSILDDHGLLVGQPEIDTDWFRAATNQQQQRGQNSTEAEMLTALEERRRQFAEEAAERRKLMEADPIGYEREHSWDPPGDVTHPYYSEHIEWVPTHALRPFREYDRRPGGTDAFTSPERWQALRSHIESEGLKNPLRLMYHEDDHVAHLGEGNHRLQIAEDLGLPSLPVTVVRGRRTSPTQVHVSPFPGRAPDLFKPSLIGLPTVPPPQTKQASRIGNWRFVEGETPYNKSTFYGLYEAPLNRRPLVQDEQIIYVGQPGAHHADLIEEFALPRTALNRAGWYDDEGYNDLTRLPADAQEATREYAHAEHGIELEQPHEWFA